MHNSTSKCRPYILPPGYCHKRHPQHDQDNCQSYCNQAVLSLGNMVHIPHTYMHQEKILDRKPQGDNTILVLSFAALVQRNQFGATIQSKILHVTVKDAVSDVSTSFRIHLCGNPTLEASGQISFII